MHRQNTEFFTKSLRTLKTSELYRSNFINTQEPHLAQSIFLTLSLWGTGIEGKSLDFPHGPVAKTTHSQCRGPRFDTWWGNRIPHDAAKSSHVAAKRYSMPQRRLMIPHVVTSTQCSQTNEEANKHKTPSYTIVSSETFVIMALSQQVRYKREQD